MTGAVERPPNVVLILADDLGFSDLGCYGSEIRTPNLDRLARSGVRFTQMYNAARCCPSRASLLTGLYAHQAGVGHMTDDLGAPSYRGYLNRSCVTIAEALRARGYTTLMSGKWHVGGGYDILNPDRWRPGDATHPTPRQRGFDRFYGIVAGAGSYFYPRTLMRDDEFVPLEDSDFYLTDAISDHAVQMLEEAASDKPFFLHVTYTAPHWPLHASDEDIAGYEGTYRKGWDAIRAARHEELKGLGLIDPAWDISPRDASSPPWDDAPDQDWEDLRMATYAAQVECMDRGIGRILTSLRRLGVEENTLVMFASDNGGCAEFLAEDTGTGERFRYDTDPLDGRRMRVGNIAGLRPGPADTFMSYGRSWANVSNSPFRSFKRWVHEGGISTPFIASWPGRVDVPAITHEPAHFVDVFATCLDAAGARYPAENDGHAVTPLEGESFLPLLAGGEWSRQQPIFFEHEGNRAVRIGPWKLVSEFGGGWELYDMIDDRTELHDVSGRCVPRVEAMAARYGQWAERCGVRAWRP
ncbi:arylsulfatase [Jiangella aurantiaca]|uniref:Arylsulfatase n=1 Tax=Jiangella aurantiaca TaxID=2530373 RepID=A0A4R5ANI7_9ACTN|nr:arylsulfatase [Jiangella aurantiaca]TDD72594.1 arylsulfatase [Jiangella aurantiaca]